MLEEGGYQVMVAVNGDEAVSLAEKQLPEVILLEIQSPDLKGLEIDIKRFFGTIGNWNNHSR